jgi:cytosine/adenosine deaminase-related metal-dependent hydrolase
LLLPPPLLLLLLLLAGLFDVATALTVGLKVGLGTDIAGGYSPMLLLLLLLLLLQACLMLQQL